MHRIFPNPLVACIRDGRPPLDEEMAALAAKLWNEGVRFLDAAGESVAWAMAQAALCGARTKA